MTTLLISHSQFVDHDTGPHHPERPDRMRAINKVLEHEAFQYLVRSEAPLRDDDAEYIVMAHSQPHLELVRRVTGEVTDGIAELDEDTVISPGTGEAARRGVGAALDAVDAVMTGEYRNAFCQVRPPGHHAEREKAMGFCFYNSAAVAAYYARAKHGAERVAVIDFDVHHGNGTQDIFWNDKDLFYGSTHQMPLFPGTGALNETGVGNIFNAPLREGDDRVKYQEAFLERIVGPLRNFSPDLVILSAGFDAHVRDPLGGLRLVEADFAWLTEQVAKVAHQTANGRIVSMLEGGYDLTGLARSVAVHVKTLMDVGI